MTTENKESPAPWHRATRLVRLTGNAVRSYLARLLHIEEEHKLEIYKLVFRGAEFNELNYWLEIVFAIGIATLGLITNSPAVVIGAMLISPLMGPIIANGLAIALGDFYLGFKSLLTLLFSTLGSILLAAFITWVLPFRNPTAEILARVQPTLLDLGIAILSGMAGAAVICRGGRGGGVTALPGVAIAVALMPPLGVVGFGVGVGWEWEIIRGGGLLFLTNLVAIIFSSFLVFFSVRMDSRTARDQIAAWLEVEKAHENFYAAIQRTPLRKVLGHVGSFPRRVLILAVFLVSVAFPLQRTWNKLRQEASVRRVVLFELDRVIPREAVFQQNTEILPDRLAIRLVVGLPDGLPQQNREELEKVIAARTNLPTQLTVMNIATHEELSEWTRRLSTAKAEPVVTSVQDLRARLLERIRPAIAATWPADRAPLLDYEVSATQGEPGLRITLAFLSKVDLGPLGEDAIRKALADRIGLASVEVAFVRSTPETPVSFVPRSERFTSAATRDLGTVAQVLRRYRSARCVVGMRAANETGLAPLERLRWQTIRSFFEREGIEMHRIVLAAEEKTNDGAVLRLAAASF